MDQSKQGNIPIELLPNIKPALSFPGIRRLTFEPDEENRRIEWVPQHIADQLLRAPYNRPGKEATFRIAQDKLENVSQATFDQKVLESLGRLLGSEPEQVIVALKGAIRPPQARAKEK